MSLSGLVPVVLSDASVASVVESIDRPSVRVSAPPSLQPFLLAALASAPGREGVLLAVTATGRDADDLAAAVAALVERPASVATFPAWETLPHERLSPSADTVGRRLAVRRRLAHPVPGDPFAAALSVVVAPVRALLQPFVAGMAEVAPVSLRAGAGAGAGAEPGEHKDASDFDSVVRRLVETGYERTDLVERRGQFAVRGGLLDVFPPQEDHPLRVEFWGDDVEEIRWFRVADQRSLEVADDGLWAPPCREFILTDEVREAALRLAADHPALADMFAAVADGRPVPGVEALAPMLAGRMGLLVDELPAGSHVVLCDPERIRTRAADLIRTGEEFLRASWLTTADGGGAPVDLSRADAAGRAGYRELDDVRDAAVGRELRWWGVTPFREDPETETAAAGLDVGLAVGTVEARGATRYGGDVPRFLTDVRDRVAARDRVVVVHEGHGPAQRATELLADAGIGARYVESVTEAPAPGDVVVTTAPLSSGFVLPGAGLVVLTGADVTGRAGVAAREVRRMPSRRRREVDPLALAPGDFVVHEQHGVGRYVEMTSRKVGGADREYLVLEYAPGRKGHPPDRLFVPTDSLDQITRYVGGESPALHRIGGSDWAASKKRARKAVRDIAAGLIRLYAARVATPGHAFAPDSPWQRELEDAFPYAETPDQLAAIDEVKEDMEKAFPMDRVVCGDVGFGKTEIAVRAAFKAVQDGRQVAVLVPTTLLAHQHAETFTERMAQFPVTVRELSRFTPDADARAVREGLAAGTVDVVVGTHRLLQSSIRFADLGLVVVDEEQRFGVEHKEQFKQLRAAVDVLTLSATPIPRTLEMSLTGIREMSTIQTPPEERLPILTYVGPYDERTIAAAIRRELLRDGQVFYLHNRVESIERAARRVRELVPEARIATAHGQLSDESLERVMLGFWEKDYDVLVSTTIVESGLDIPNANTLLVERADLLGLSQMHQLRGRVGRGRERGYAYFMYPPERPLTETAHQRLATIAQNSDLGAGMAVAMKDLEIRGAGNLLGGEQSGHIADVGFDLYVRMVQEAVAEFRAQGGVGAGPAEAGAGAAPPRPADVRIDLPVDAHVPHDWLEVERLRLEAYQKVAAARDAAALREVAEELTDRYGPLPEPVRNLFDVAWFRLQVLGLGVTEVVSAGGRLRVSPLDLRESQQMRLARLHPGSRYLGPLPERAASVSIPLPGAGPAGGRAAGVGAFRDHELLEWIRGVLADLLGTAWDAVGGEWNTRKG